MAKRPLGKLDPTPDPPDKQKMNMQTHLTLNLTKSSSAPAAPVVHGAAGLSTNYQNMNTCSNASVTLVFHGAASPSNNHLSMIEAPSHVDHSVIINDSSPSVVIPTMYPATSCVATTTVTWTPTTTLSPSSYHLWSHSGIPTVPFQPFRSHLN